jgi:hypothetical protein
VTLAADARVGVGLGVGFGIGVAVVGSASVVAAMVVALLVLNGLVLSAAWRVVLRAAMTTTVTSAPTMSTDPAIAARRRRGA